MQTPNKDKTVSFDCQHGPGECDGNRIQSCVLNHLADNADAQTDFVACQMKFSADPSAAQVSETSKGDDCAFYIIIQSLNLLLNHIQCADKVGVPQGVITECFDGPLGTQLQLEAEQLTKVISPSFVPTIVYNWVSIQLLN